MKWLRWLFDAACVALIGYVAIRIMIEGPLVAQIGVMLAPSTAFLAWVIIETARRRDAG